MKILILGAGKMGSFFTDLLSFDHEVALFWKMIRNACALFTMQSGCRSRKR